MLNLLEDCKETMGVRTPLTLVETPATNCPALLGFVRPRLLLPAGFTSTFSRDELRYVFLHELGHIKRGDIPLNWLATIPLMVHWFDSDQNNWIDENDAVYHQLRLWNPEVTGDILSTLQERNIGAIYLKTLATPFSYKGTDHESVAELAATSVVLSSNESVGTIQQLNLVG